MGRDSPEQSDLRRAMVEGLKLRRVLSSPIVEEALLSVPRHLFVPLSLKDSAYQDTPLPIGNEQTISAPHMVSIMVEASGLRPGHKVLEIGAGSGYQAAVMAHVAGEEGHIYTMERLPGLMERARANLEAAGLEKRVTVLLGDGSLGLPEHQPYDRIFVTCGAPKLPPPLFEQLAEGGMLLIPEGGLRFQTLMEYRKKKGKMLKKSREDVMFVPLIGEHGF
ncbi:MAG: protein-L-isoaspartate(D-aspartate) O-methyltransferase [Thermoplasmata archaeon]|nr:protein-L-isoaspartate(D-aspartate) O-methyltransferase [Thermoplasmata archaeon]